MCELLGSREAVLGPNTFLLVWPQMTTSSSRGREGQSELEHDTGKEKRLPTQQVGKRVEKEMPPVKRCAWEKDFLADGAGERGNKLAAGAKNYCA